MLVVNNTTSTVKSYSNRIVYDYKLLSQIQIHLIPLIHINKSLLTNQMVSEKAFLCLYSHLLLYFKFLYAKL